MISRLKLHLEKKPIVDWKM